MSKLWGRYLKMNSAVSLDIIKSGPSRAKAIPQILGGTFSSQSVILWQSAKSKNFPEWKSPIAKFSDSKILR